MKARSGTQNAGSGNAFAGPAQGGAPVDSARISKELLQEIRRGDAAMAEDLVALAPHSGRAFRGGVAAGLAGEGRAASRRAGGADALTASGNNAGAATATSHSAAAAAAAPLGSGGPTYSVRVNDNLTASDFVKQKREVGLVRMSLATKKAEVRKLDEKMDRAEKRLRQQQEQLTNTQEKFNNFLKFSNLEQDAAVRKADDETRAKHAKTLEVKKLSALINHAELETRKTRLQIDNCIAYKDFLESLAKSQWFYDVLADLRMEDKREDILFNAEAAYQKRCAQLAKTFEEQAAARQALKETEEREKQRRRSSSGRRPSVASAPHVGREAGRGSNGTVAPRDDRGAEEGEEEVVSLEQQMSDLHDAMEVEARADLQEAETAIRAEVAAMPLSAVKAALHGSYDESRLPMCFTSVDDLLDVFINVEEGNLFLIQNCQELEEELEGISVGFMEEKTEMDTMVSQRTAQLAVLEENIAEAREKLRLLDDRIAALEPHGGRGGNGSAEVGKSGAGGGAAAAGTAAAAGGAGSSSSNSGSGGGAAGAAAGAAQAELSPEELKVRIEASVGHMFQLLTAGDQIIKANMNHANASKREDGVGESGAGRARSASLKGASGSAKTQRVSSSPADGATGKVAAQSKKTPKKDISAASPSSTTAAKKPKSASGTTAPNHHNQQQQQQQQQQRDASIGPVEMLTIVENKLDEYHRYLTDPNNRVDATLIQSVMKQSDKQRRRQARLVHLASQEQEQEERIRRALERSQAPIAHRIGKPARPRSHLQQVVDAKTQRKAVRTAAAMEGSGTSIDSDEDGAEFFR